jgi:4-hydroxybenzoate polyprenyltransferase
VNWPAGLQIVLLTFPLNLIGCGLNDIYDYESDRLCSRRAKIWGAVVDESSRPLVWAGVLAMTPLVIAGAFPTRNGWNIAATCGLVAIAWAYSVPPLRLKERPPLDSLANGLGYFWLPFLMGYSLAGDPSSMPARYYLLALCVSGIHALAAAADYEVDRAAGHRTIAVVYGRRSAAAFTLAGFLVALVLGDFVSNAARAYLWVGGLASLAVLITPQDRVISAACVVIFAAFPLAAVLYLLGI